MEKNIKLTYYQVMIFIKEIDRLKKEDENLSYENKINFVANMIVGLRNKSEENRRKQR